MKENIFEIQIINTELLVIEEGQFVDFVAVSIACLNKK